jgi:ZIP family zinc transporter
MSSNTVVFALLLTLIAGLSTAIGGLLSFFSKKTNTRFLSVALGFSAGVMIYVSMVEMFQEAKQSLVSQFGSYHGNWATVAAFFSGILIMAVIDTLVPSYENPHTVRGVEDMERRNGHTDLVRMGIVSAIAIAIHNFPEGLATFTAGLTDMSIAIPIAIAIAIHNIPEGIAVSVPLYYGTGSRRKALLYSCLAGLSEPLGALVGFLLFGRFLNQMILGLVFAMVAGIMVYISFDELLPAAERYGEHHLAISGLVSGMFVMAVSLILMS